MWPGMMPILHSSGVMTPGQLGPISREAEPPSARLTRTMSSTGNALGDADDQFHLGVDRLQDGVGRERRRHVDHAGVGAGADGLGHGVEHRQVEMGGAALAGGHAADHRVP
jgi:hypothetical protein